MYTVFGQHISLLIADMSEELDIIICFIFISSYFHKSMKDGSYIYHLKKGGNFASNITHDVDTILFIPLARDNQQLLFIHIAKKCSYHLASYS